MKVPLTFRNPLVDPGIIGVSSGAALVAALYIVMIQPFVPPDFALYGLPVAAFLGGWLVTFILYLLSQRNGQLHIAIMLLFGIALAAFTGSLAGMNWKMVAIIGVVVAVCSPLIWREHRALNALTLGEEDAQYIGFVACVGAIGFIGLVVSHLMRLMGGSNHRYLLPNSLM